MTTDRDDQAATAIHGAATTNGTSPDGTTGIRQPLRNFASVAGKVIGIEIDDRSAWLVVRSLVTNCVYRVAYPLRHEAVVREKAKLGNVVVRGFFDREFGDHAAVFIRGWNPAGKNLTAADDKAMARVPGGFLVGQVERLLPRRLFDLAVESDWNGQKRTKVFTLGLVQGVARGFEAKVTIGTSLRVEVVLKGERRWSYQDGIPRVTKYFLQEVRR